MAAAGQIRLAVVSFWACRDVIVVRPAASAGRPAFFLFSFRYWAAEAAV